jgi:hypothetical protein
MEIYPLIELVKPGFALLHSLGANRFCGGQVGDLIFKSDC